MLQFFRKHQTYILVVAAAVIISFTVWTPGRNDHGMEGYHREIAGHVYDQTDLDASRQIYQMAQMSTSFSDAPGRLFGLFMVAKGAVRQRGEMAQIEDILVNLVTVREEANRLGVHVEDEDVKKAVESLKRFQTDGKFDRAIFDSMFSGPASDANQRHFFAMMKHALLVEKLQKLIGAPMQATDYDVALDYNKAHVKTTVQVVVLPRKEHESLKPSDEEVQKYYDANKDKKVEELDPVLRSESSRDVRYIKVERVKRDDISKLPPAEQETKKKEWDAQDKKVSSTASVISNALVDETKPVSIEEAAEVIKVKAEAGKEAPAAPVGVDPNYVAVEIKKAEKLTVSNRPEELKTEEAAVAEIIENGKGVVKISNGWIIFESSEAVAPRLLTLEEAKTKLVEKLTKDKIEAALQDKASGVRSKIQEALTAGKPFAEALTAAAVEAKSYTYSAKTPAKDAPAYFQAVQEAVKSLNSGSLAVNPIPAGDDLAVVFLEKSELMDDPKMVDDKKTLKRTSGYNDSPFQPSPVFVSWFNQRRSIYAPVYGEEVQ